nr:MAG TPA: hypothetical protein [Caudoviricetes sp.]
MQSYEIILEYKPLIIIDCSLIMILSSPLTSLCFFA